MPPACSQPIARVGARETGTALVFGGDVTHAGMPVEAGLRSVFVASFSTRTSGSPEARCYGLQQGTSVDLQREQNRLRHGLS